MGCSKAITSKFKPITVKNKDKAGGVQIPPPPMQDFWHVEGELVVCIGDKVKPHGDGEHSSPVMVEGSGWFTLNDIPVCRETDRASCCHPTTGRQWWWVS